MGSESPCSDDGEDNSLPGYDDFLYRPDAQVKLEALPLYLFNSLLEEGRILYRFSINQ